MVNGIEGAVIGSSINSELKIRGYKEKKVAVLNDTVSVLLGSLMDEDNHPSRTIAFVLGTGFNSCYSQKADEILKLKEAFPSDYMIICNESGAYNNFPKGSFDIELDNTTIDTGIFGLEKMVSGRYFGYLLHLIVLGAVKDGLFSKQFL